MTIADIQDLARRGESESIEFKRSTGQLGLGAEALCAFLEGRGGSVLVGVSPDRRIVGQFVNDNTLQDVAPVQIHRVPVPDSGQESRPFRFDGRPYERIGSNASLMSQEKYQRLLLERAHASHRWESLSASSLDDLGCRHRCPTIPPECSTARD